MEKDFKNNIKNKFQDRKISPSENLWHRIEMELDHQPKKINYKKYLFWASCVAILLVSFYIFSVEISKEKISNNSFYTFSKSDKIKENKDNPEKKQENLVLKPKDLVAFEDKIPSKEKKKNQVKEPKKIIISEEKLSEIFSEIPFTDSLKVADNGGKISEEERLLKEVEIEIRAERLLHLIENQIKEEAKLKNYDLAAKELLSEIEKENLRDRIYHFFRKIEREIDKTGLAIEEKVQSIKFL